VTAKQEKMKPSIPKPRLLDVYINLSRGAERERERRRERAESTRDRETHTERRDSAEEQARSDVNQLMERAQTFEHDTDMYAFARVRADADVRTHMNTHTHTQLTG